MDIATLLENHRKHMLAGVDSIEYDSEQERENSKFAIAHAHDRATTRTLLDLYRQGGGQAGNGQPVTGSASTTTVAQPSRKVKAGSKKARERALKAGETRRKNLAARAGQSHGNTPENPKLAAVANQPTGQPFVQTGEGGGQ